MAITLKMHNENEDNGKEEKKSTSNCCFPTIACIAAFFILAALLYVIYTYIEINYLLTETKRLAEEEDDIKIRLYILESDYYLDEIDKEESKFNHLANDFKKFTRYATARKPECTYQKVIGQPQKDIEDVERMAINNINYFKHILNSWLYNLDYMDLDGTLNKLLGEYEDIYFNRGDWKEEKVDKRLKNLKDFYANLTVKLEECTIPSAFQTDIRRNLQTVREKLKLHEDEIEDQLYKFNQLDEDVIKTMNRLAFENIMCLASFPDYWESIRKEEILAEQGLDVLKFKLQQIRYNLMAADTPEKVENLIKWEEEYSKKKSEKLKNIDKTHYQEAVNMYKAALKEVDKCHKNGKYLF